MKQTSVIGELQFRRTENVVLIAVVVMIAGNVSAAKEEVVSPPRGQLEYRFSNGTRVILEWVNATTRSRSDGVTIHHTRWGNHINRTGPKPVSFSPHNGQLPEQPMSAGLTWEHQYEVRNKRETYRRWRQCRVTDRGLVTITTGTFRDAWKIQGTNQRADRDLPMYETPWYTSHGRILLKHNARWEGTRPGGNGIELMSFDQTD